MEITVKFLTGDNVTVKVDTFGYASDIKRGITQARLFSGDRQKLLFRGKQLTDDVPLVDFGLTSGSIIYIFCKGDYATYMSSETGLAKTVSLDLGNTAKDLKVAISKLDGISPSKQILLVSGKQLDDDDTLSHDMHIVLFVKH